MKYTLAASPYELLGLFAWFLFSAVAIYWTGSYTRNKKIVTDYNNLKTPFRPPPWVFSFAWIVLYSLTAFNGFYVWQKVIEYKANGADINMDIDREIGNDVTPWHYYTIIFLHASTWVLGPLWFYFFFVKKWFITSVFVILVYTKVAILLTVFGYLMDWVVGLLYTPLAVWMIFATSLNLIICVLHNQDESKKYNP
jgi:tryptophan-rich sensory protein